MRKDGEDWGDDDESVHGESHQGEQADQSPSVCHWPLARIVLVAIRGKVCVGVWSGIVGRWKGSIRLQQWLLFIPHHLQSLYDMRCSGNRVGNMSSVVAINDYGWREMNALCPWISQEYK